MAYNNSTSTYSQYPNPSIFPAPVLPLDLALLTALCKIQGKSGDEGDMQAFILTFLTAQGLNPHSDANGNITCTKGQADAYPTLVAHLDTVHTSYQGYDVALSDDGHILYAYAPTERKYQAPKRTDNLSRLVSGAQTQESSLVQCGVGGDDRCGLYVALHLLTHLPAAKVCFVVEEEIGMTKGSRFVDLAFFDDAAIVLQCDRKGHDDWVQTVSGTQVSGNEFISSIRDLLTYHKYTVTQNGGPTDVGALKSRGLGVVAANMSCGYYNPHSSTETIFLPALANTLNLCLSVLERVGYVKQLHAHVAYQAPLSSYQQQNSRWDDHRSSSGSYKLALRNPFGGSFSAFDYGWAYTSADELDKKHGIKGLRIGGLCKVVNDKLVGPYTSEQVKDYEREAAEDKALAVVNAQAKVLKDAKKALKAWVLEDGSWEHNKLKGEHGQWVKWLSDGGAEDLLYPVAYAKLMADIPVAEKEFRYQWDGCYGPDAGAIVTNGGEITFSAETISKFVHEVLDEQQAKLAAQQTRGSATQHQLPFDDGSDTYSVTNIGEQGGASYRVTRKYINGQLVSTTTESGETLTDHNAVHCPACDAACVAPELDSMDGMYFYCEECKEWKCEEDEVLDNGSEDNDDDAYSRYLGKHQGQWRDSAQQDYERAYGRD